MLPQPCIRAVASLLSVVAFGLFVVKQLFLREATYTADLPLLVLTLLSLWGIRSGRGESRSDNHSSR